MAPRYISVDAFVLNSLFKDVSFKIKKKQDEMDTNTLNVVKAAFLQNIEEIDNLLRHPSVRGHVDPTILEPEVDGKSSFKNLRRRLGRQVKAACILADVAHLGPEANANEAEALSRLREILYQLCDTISPSDTATDSD